MVTQSTLSNGTVAIKLPLAQLLSAKVSLEIIDHSPIKQLTRYRGSEGRPQLMLEYACIYML